ncbi:MAG: hypothetical protein Q9227_003580 [Pyrenula ochraceoflavens]
MSAFHDILFGSLAGIVGKFIEYPFDTVKVRLQSSSAPSPSVLHSAPSSITPSQPHFTGPLSVLVHAHRTSGLLSLYRGISAPLFGAAIETSSLFFSYRIAKNVLVSAVPSLSHHRKQAGEDEPDLPFRFLLICGAASGAFTSLLLTPIELVKCKMQVPAPAHNHEILQHSKQPGPLRLIAQIFREQGFFGFWHGQLGTLIRETGGSAAWFGGYEGVKAFFLSLDRRKTADGELPIRRTDEEQNKDKKNQKGELKFYQQLLAGATAGVMYNFTFYPADTIKSRMQTEELSPFARQLSPTSATVGENSSNTKAARQAFLATGKELWRRDGLKGFYRGCGITCLRSAPSSAFIFAVYEGLKSRFG